jgi:DNA-binding XRE family transcriptional regulator
MGRTFREASDTLPADKPAIIGSRRVGLRELRQLAGKGQADIASALNIKQPSVSKIEQQTDMYLSTLRSYVEALGGKLELSVRLPKHPALRIHHLGDTGVSAKLAQRSGSVRQTGGRRGR